MSFYECEFCGKKYVSEGHFKKHECEEMRRYNHLKTPKGLAAYQDFATWLKYRGFSNLNQQQFMDSKYYSSFVKFVDFAHRMALPAKDKFIKLMVKTGILPKDWTDNMVYDFYIEEYDTLLACDKVRLRQLTLERGQTYR